MVLGTLLMALGTLLLPVAAQAETLNYKLPKFEAVAKPTLVLGPAGEHFTFLRTGADTGGQFTVAKAIIPPGAGPIPHIHTLTDEWFYFPKGGITIFCDPVHAYSSLKAVPNSPGVPAATAQAIQTKDNSLYYGPHDYLHGFYNNTDQDLEITFVWGAKPGEEKNPAADISGYFFSVGRVVEQFTAAMKPSDAEKVAFVVDAPKWGINQSSYFMQYLSSIVPAGKTSPFVHENDQVKRLERYLSMPVRQNKA
jgi:mannose-6-phosphate isomerase-like protein (cupin superfamily)